MSTQTADRQSDAALNQAIYAVLACIFLVGVTTALALLGRDTGILALSGALALICLSMGLRYFRIESHALGEPWDLPAVGEIVGWASCIAGAFGLVVTGLFALFGDPVNIGSVLWANVPLCLGGAFVGYACET